MEQITQIEAIYIRKLLKDEIIKNQLIIEEKEKEPQKNFIEITYLKANQEQLEKIFNKLTK